MIDRSGPHPLLQGLDKSAYDVHSLNDEIRVDRLCVDLLRHLYQDLLKLRGTSPEQAGESCHGADYFLREFIIADRRASLFAVDASHIRQFAGHWYIIRTPEPNLKELAGILSGTAEFYHFLARQGLMAEDLVNAIASACLELDYYQERIKSFWAIEGDGYDAWRQACPLAAVKD